MQGSANPTIRARDLACRRGDRVLFRRLSLELGPGEAYHVTGANGAGKTTLLRTLAGLAEPYAGEAAITGRAALLDERPGLEPDWPLARALGFWFALDGAADVPAILARLRLAELAEVPVRFLSTGQKKRAALARLIGQGAEVWLLDEPLSGLDSASQGLVSALVAEHCARGGIALVASHQPLAVPGLKAIAIEDYAPPPLAEPMPEDAP
ncbi:MAG: heme ABC exporter ATP-binding protein CcmA [Erythrobacter sp.]|jgi:heme exporter protein A|nr:heme ABC exporter ATP-binding protein CcmA [Erythrobacter sp.]